MGKYTILNDPKIDNCIDQKLDQIVPILKAQFPQAISIVLGGGFGRGEGSVRIRDGVISLQRDFDIYLIFKAKRIDWAAIRRVQHLLHDQIGVTQSNDYELLDDFHIDLCAFKLDDISIYTDTHTYDLKSNITLYGEDIRSLVTWTAYDIPFRCGLRILLEQLYKMTCVFSLDYLKSGVPRELEGNILREISKIYIYMGAALSIFARCYTTSDVKRVDILKNAFKTTFVDLDHTVPEFIKRVEESTRYKVSPESNLNYDIIDYWFETRQTLELVLKYCLKKYLSIESNNWIEISSSLEKYLAKTFYLPLITLKLRKSSIPECLVCPANYLYNLTSNTCLTATLLRDKILFLPLLSASSSPAIKLFSVLPLILFSVDRASLAINETYLMEANRRLKFIPLPESHNPWDDLRLKVLKFNSITSITI